jgi:hypothetical protein
VILNTLHLPEGIAYPVIEAQKIYWSVRAENTKENQLDPRIDGCCSEEMQVSKNR